MNMSKWKSALLTFVSIFVLYAAYMWFIKENHDLPQLLLESLLFGGVLTVLSTGLDVVKSKFVR